MVYRDSSGEARLIFNLDTTQALLSGRLIPRERLAGTR